MAEDPGRVKEMLTKIEQREESWFWKENISSGFGMLIRDKESSGL